MKFVHILKVFGRIILGFVFCLICSIGYDYMIMIRQERTPDSSGLVRIQCNALVSPLAFPSSKNWVYNEDSGEKLVVGLTKKMRARRFMWIILEHGGHDSILAAYDVEFDRQYDKLVKFKLNNIKVFIQYTDAGDGLRTLFRRVALIPLDNDEYCMLIQTGWGGANPSLPQFLAMADSIVHPEQYEHLSLVTPEYELSSDESDDAGPEDDAEQEEGGHRVGRRGHP